MIQHRVNNNEVTTVELCDNCETYVRDLALEDWVYNENNVFDGMLVNDQTITRTEKRTCLCNNCD